jgi:hypothetical protein
LTPTVLSFQPANVSYTGSQRATSAAPRGRMSALAVELVADAQLDFVETVEHVELGHAQARHAVDLDRARSAAASSQPVRRGRPVTEPNSLPTLASVMPTGSWRCGLSASYSSLGNGPEPTRVQYALVMPRM